MFGEDTVNERGIGSNLLLLVGLVNSELSCSFDELDGMIMSLNFSESQLVLISVSSSNRSILLEFD